MLQKLLVQTYHFLSGKEKDASHISMTHAFSPAQFSISLWLLNHFGLFPCFSLPYIHFHLLSSVFHSGFTFILDFFPAFLCFMSIFTCSVQYFSPASRSFWTFSCFSRSYVHTEEYGRLRTTKSCTEAEKVNYHLSAIGIHKSE